MDRIKSQQLFVIREIGRWLVISAIAGILCGIASAVLLAALQWATNWRESHIWIVAFLPLAGLVSGLIYHYFGQSVEAGNNLLLEEIHNPQQVIPLRMAILILMGTVVTHLFGGSAGREGTALQMGTALSDRLTGLWRLKKEDRRILLMCGISGGVASVFGTPLAGTLFGLEVLAIGRIRYDGLFPCLIAAIVGDYTTSFIISKWGGHRTEYDLVGGFATNLQDLTGNVVNLISAVIAGIIFGLTALLFTKVTHRIKEFFKSKIPYPPLRPMFGGIIIAIAVLMIGTTKYIGLGIPTIISAFQTELPLWDFAAKIIFTAITIGSGFKGGEATPLFYIGATLGSALSLFLPLPTSVLAGMGFVAVFGAAANTPISSTLMAMELFGLPIGMLAGIACVVSYLVSGHNGIYSSQRISTSKSIVSSDRSKNKSDLDTDLDEDT